MIRRLLVIPLALAVMAGTTLGASARHMMRHHMMMKHHMMMHHHM